MRQNRRLGKRQNNILPEGMMWNLRSMKQQAQTISSTNSLQMYAVLWWIAIASLDVCKYLVLATQQSGLRRVQERAVFDLKLYQRASLVCYMVVPLYGTLYPVPESFEFILCWFRPIV